MPVSKNRRKNGKKVKKWKPQKKPSFPVDKNVDTTTATKS